jgi:hypothetical protein
VRLLPQDFGLRPHRRQPCITLQIGHDGQLVTTNFGMIELVTTNFGMIVKKPRQLAQFGRSIGKNHEFNQDDLA